MKIAIITTRNISLTSGADRRNYHLAEELQRKHTVRVYTPHREHEPNENMFYRILTILGGRIPYIERLKKISFDKATIKELEHADIIQLEEMNAYYLFEKYLTRMKGKIVLDTHNIDFIRFLSETDTKGFIEKYLGKILANKIKRNEIQAIKKMDHILVCSEKEQVYFSQHIDKKRISIIPNGAVLPTNNSSAKTQKNTILFMGLLSYPPNSQGINYYIEHVHPHVIKQIPNAELIILGKEAPTWLIQKTTKDKTIKLKGFVKEVTPYINQATVCICPIQSGSGTRLKILEYMAQGKPVVSTTLGAEGIHIQHKKNILLADTTKGFAREIISLMQNEKLAQKLGKNAQVLINEHYSWKTIGKALDSLYKTLVK